jgi:hypothetical protein
MTPVPDGGTPAEFCEDGPGSPALLPFAVLFSAFLIFKMDAFRASLSAWIAEFLLVLVFYRMPLLKSLEASVWGNLSMWTGFLVLYTGQIFGQAYRSTGLLEILLESIRSMLPSVTWKGIGGPEHGRQFHRRVQRLRDSQ